MGEIKPVLMRVLSDVRVTGKGKKLKKTLSKIQKPLNFLRMTICRHLVERGLKPVCLPTAEFFYVLFFCDFVWIFCFLFLNVCVLLYFYADVMGCLSNCTCWWCTLFYLVFSSLRLVKLNIRNINIQNCKLKLTPFNGFAGPGNKLCAIEH